MGKISYNDAVDKALKLGKGERLDCKMVKWSKEDNVLIGKFISQDELTGVKFEGSVQRYLFDTDAGQMSCLLGSAADKQLAGTLKPGDLLRITFEGQKDIGDSKTMNVFSIERFGNIGKGE